MTPSATISPHEVLRKYKTIAVVGASKNPAKDAYTVPQFMKEHGYKIIPVNPTADDGLSAAAGGAPTGRDHATAATLLDEITGSTAWLSLVWESKRKSQASTASAQHTHALSIYHRRAEHRA